jgi:phosphate transport system substrate-binding protein
MITSAKSFGDIEMVKCWTCSGVAKDSQQHPNQKPQGVHAPYDNFGSDCVICNLTREQVLGGGSKVPAKAVALALTASLMAALGAGAWIMTRFIPSQSQEPNTDNPSVSVPPVSSPPETPDESLTPLPAVKFPLLSPPLANLADMKDVPKMRVRYGGSTTLAPIRPRRKWYADRSLPAQRPDEAIMQAFPDFELLYTDPPTGEKPGSGSGIRMLLDGQLSIAQSSRPVKPEEFAEAEKNGFRLEQTAIAIDGIVLYINPQLSLPGLTLAQVKDIYTGKITNWKDVGGPDLAIVAFSREPNDGGTPEYFREHILGEDASIAPSVQIIQDTTTSLRKVMNNPGGIGYATASEVCNQPIVKAVALAKTGTNFVAPCNGEEVNRSVFADDSYGITRRLFVVIKRDGAIDEQAGATYANFLLTDEGQRLIEQAGFVSLR